MRFLFCIEGTDGTSVIVRLLVQNCNVKKKNICIGKTRVKLNENFVSL